MDFTRPDFYAAPFPSDDLRAADGTLSLGAFPNPDQIDLVQSGLALITRDARGFATTGGVFFALSGPIDGHELPTLEGSTASSASVFLVDVDPASADFGARTPIEVAFEADGGRFGAPNLLSLLPFQGAPLRASELYAAVVLRKAAAPSLAVASAITSILAGQAPAGMPAATFAEYQTALGSLAKSGVATADIAALSVFTTDAPLDAMQKVVTAMLAQPPPAPPPFTLTDTFPDYCVYQSTLSMPDYQEGQPPYTSTGGDWTFDAQGNPILQVQQTATLYVTIPRSAMPAAGWPTMVFIRTGAGGDRPLVDRGTQPGTGDPAITPGTGPAMEFARAGYAGVQVDGPLGGLRNLGPNGQPYGNEDYEVFNIFNPPALRDTVRESAAELVLFAHALDGISLDVSGCAGASPGTSTFATSTLGIMGHSMGASILPLTIAFEPRFKDVVLSGAGASWIENVMYKEQPLNVLPAIELLIDYDLHGLTLTDHDPVLTVFQWAAEPADSQIYARRILREPPAGFTPPNVFQVQGIVDHYIMPPIANALTASVGLDLAGKELDSITPEIEDLMPISATFPISGRKAIGYPVQGNFDGVATAVVAQWPSDGIEDGHETIFQTEPPKYQYKCFLQSTLTGVPVIPDGTGHVDTDACP